MKEKCPDAEILYFCDAAGRYLNAIIEAWSPGEKGAEVVTVVIFGNYNPGRKFPVSVAYNAGQISV